MLPIHRETADRIIAELSKDSRIAGIAAGGSWLTGMDAYSDLDLVIAVYPESEAAVSRERFAIAKRCGPLLTAFTGEHVGEPRLLICLYGPPLLHVDLKFAALSDLATNRVEDPAILWERNDDVSRALTGARAHYPQPDLQWIEDRFWIWVHYGALKIGRGELFEAIDFIGYLRQQVLGPLLLLRAGKRPTGVRRIEQASPEASAALEKTLCLHDRASCGKALRAAIDLYRELRRGQDIALRNAAELAAVGYLDETLSRPTATSSS
ncbi:nucleotidyltransferase domain-containing protein [Pendulispora brunnea]|uniref:Nucleotidyltransferase domain-containing protein n=1 Tax=Pendulispora brunnea TaxID=2905690 RepID=A0ABZ2KB44_9BACT